MRSILLGDYDTAGTGLWTLASWKLSPAVYKSNLVEVPASDIVLDLSTALTDGEPRYSPRPLTITLESSEGDRLARKARIDEMINKLDGQRVHIKLPDDADHYLVGRLSVQELYNDLAHASVQVDTVCEPWKYAEQETEYNLTASSTQQSVVLINKGRRSVVPTLLVTGGTITLTYGNSTWTLTAGTYQLPDIYLTPTGHTIGYKGSGKLLVKFREAVL